MEGAEREQECKQDEDTITARDIQMTRAVFSSSFFDQNKLNTFH
jgi:hypothetical protein